MFIRFLAVSTSMAAPDVQLHSPANAVDSPMTTDNSTIDSTIDPGLGVPDRDALTKIREFAVADDRIAVWQVVSTLAVLILAIVLVPLLPGAWALLAVPLIAGVSIRIFVLQHD